MAHIILGLPGENTDTFENTLTLLYDLNPDGISLNICTPYPGTKIWDTIVFTGMVRTQAVAMSAVEHITIEFRWVIRLNPGV